MTLPNTHPGDASLSKLAGFCLERSSEAILWLNPEGRILYSNEVACRALGYDPADLQQRSFFTLSPDLSRDLWTQFWKELAKKDRFDFEFMLRSKTDRQFPVEINAHQFCFDSQKYAVVFFRDIEERKRLQQLKDEFVSTVSHELRTPMTIIREGVSQVIEGLRGNVTPEQRRALTIALTGIDRLGRIINELLDVSKIESGKMALRYDRIDLKAVMRDVCGTFRLVAQERGLEIKTNLPKTPVEVFADRDRILQVMTNLLGNAMKFTEKGSITVSIEPKSDEVECSVRDTGTGIAEEDLGRIFNKFEQLGHVSATGEKGTGLGLSICKGIIQLHRGKIWAESTPGRGAMFFFTLPREKARDVFRRQITALTDEAFSRAASLTAIAFDIRTATKRPIPAGAYRPLLDGLESLIREHTGHTTDILVKDEHAIFVGMPATVKNEAVRVVTRISEAFAAELAREDLTDKLTLACEIFSFPEEAATPKAFIQRLFQEAS